MLNYEKLKENFEYPDAKVVEFNEEQIFVKQYLPSEDKYGIIYVCLMSLDLQKQSYNPLLAEILFDIQIVKEYTNIIFEEVSDSYFKQFDILHNIGLIDLVVANIPQQEYEELQRVYYTAIEEAIKYSGNIGNSINNLFTDVNTMGDIDPDQIAKGMELVEKLSKEQHI